MPTHDKSDFSPSDKGPINKDLFSIESDDDALWMLLNSYADGEATPEEILQVETILRTHPEVSRDFAFLQLTSESVREFTEIEPPVSLSGAIFAATTHRITWKQRAAAWLTQFGRTLAPAPLRFGLVGGALAAGVLAFVLWPRHNVHPVSQPVTAQNTSPAIIQSHPPIVKITPRNVRPVTTPANTPIPVIPREAPGAFDLQKAMESATIAHVDIPVVNKVPDRISKPVTTEVKTITVAKHDSPKIKSDAPTGIVFSPSKINQEERHMALNSGDAGNTTAQSLGPDVHASTADDTHIETASMTDNMTVPPSHDDAPPVRVSTVSYKPGSISEAVRSAPPSLAMRANEAIRREQELQKYAGYGKDAVNNIQRGEVGFSLVGGKF